MNKKVCPKCGKLKPLLLFHRNRSKETSTQTYCKECLALYIKERSQDADVRREKSKNDLQACTGCGNVAPMHTYQKDSKKASGWSIYCNECLKVITSKQEFINEVLIQQSN